MAKISSHVDEPKLWEIDPPEFYLATLNRQIRESMNACLRRHHMKLVEWRILQTLEQNETLTIQDLSMLAAIERTVASRLVEKLAARKLVSKTTPSHDKRFVQVFLTAKGRKAYRDTVDDVYHLRAALFARLGEDDIAHLVRTVRILQENATSLSLMRPVG